MSVQHPDHLELSVQELMCGICFSTVSDPKTTPCCRAMYCKDCAFESLNHSKHCPYCRTEITKKSLMSVPRLIDNLLDSIGKVRPSSTSVRTPPTLSNPINSSSNLTQTTSAETRINYLEQTNSGLENEIYRLRRRLNDIQIPVVSLSSSTSRTSGVNSNMRSVIDLARAKINDYVIEENSGAATSNWVRNCIEICRESVRNERSYLRLSESIADQLNNKMGASRTWHSIVWQRKCAESGITTEKGDRFLRLRFNELIIEVFAV